MKQKKRHGSKKNVQKQVKTTYFANFLRREKQKETETTKEHYSPWRTNKQETVSFEKKKETVQKVTILNNIAFLWRRDKM